MELWIRSQDKEDLIKIENVKYWNETQIAVNVQTSFNNVDYVVVGEYKSKERALEVLDEIQNKINNFEAELYASNQLHIGNVEIPSLVYEMPKE